MLLGEFGIVCSPECNSLGTRPFSLPSETVGLEAVDGSVPVKGETHPVFDNHVEGKHCGDGDEDDTVHQARVDGWRYDRSVD
jgi:hypothetical protein